MRTAPIIALLLLCSGHVLAANQTFQLQPFSALSLARGMNVTVKCGDRNTLAISGNTNLVDKLTWQVSGNTLTVNNTAYHENGFDFNPNKLGVTITTTTPITTVDAQFGVAVDMAACSYTSDTLNLDGTMGASYTVSGTIDTLNLTLSMGADFNQASQNLRINQANVELSMGVDANVCGAQQAQGTVSMGAKIVVGERTQTDQLKVSLAGKHSRQSC
ncbi:TPA: GIN domain-containing protein [Serratia fonticola]|uniref:GIN domain-containing protein n=1 Tax=Serratia fonticola TaxID=47917 RepID=UPI0034C5E211